MKKFGILIFIAACLIGLLFSNLFSFGFGTSAGDVLKFDLGGSVKGSGTMKAEQRNIYDFTGVDAGGVFEVQITVRSDFAVEVEADDNLLQYIETEVRDGILHISTTRKLRTENPLKIRVSAPDIKSLDASGVAKFHVSNLSNASFDADISGAAKITAAGTTADLNVDVSGASKFDGTNLSAENADVETSGAGRVIVNALNGLNAASSGASSVLYIGEPTNIESKTSGVSSIRQFN